MPFVDHISLGVTDLAAGSRFYEPLLHTLGSRRLFQDAQFVGYGNGPANGHFSLSRTEQRRRQPGAHLCFAAGNREEVERFYRAGIDAGAGDNGAPGYRLHYDPDFFGAFLIDPFGNNVGVVARLRPETGSMPRARVIDHLSIGAAAFAAMARFYDTLFATLNVQRLYTSEEFIIYGHGINDTTFMLLRRPDATGPQSGFHACFTAGSADQVRTFHDAGIAAGGRDNGAPGLRPEYSRDYYGAFVTDPEGNRLGVVARVQPEAL